MKACRGMEVQLHVSVMHMSKGAFVVDMLITVGRSASLLDGLHRVCSKHSVLH
jgi:hypothetical protein